MLERKKDSCNHKLIHVSETNDPREEYKVKKSSTAIWIPFIIRHFGLLDHQSAPLQICYNMSAQARRKKTLNVSGVLVLVLHSGSIFFKGLFSISSEPQIFKMNMSRNLERTYHDQDSFLFLIFKLIFFSRYKCNQTNI